MDGIFAHLPFTVFQIMIVFMEMAIGLALFGGCFTWLAAVMSIGMCLVFNDVGNVCLESALVRLCRHRHDRRSGKSPSAATTGLFPPSSAGGTARALPASGISTATILRNKRSEALQIPDAPPFRYIGRPDFF